MSRIVMLMSGVNNPVCIGAISTSLTQKALGELWDKWREEVPHPDADSEFVEWAIENDPNCAGVPFSDFEFMTIDE